MKKILKSKRVLLLLLGVFYLSFNVQEVKACDIEFEIVKGKKDNYKAGDEIVVKVKVKLTHRTCDVGIKKTKFKMKGIKIIGATKWKKLSAMEYERKLKIKILSNKKGKLILNAVRTCDKDGGFGSLILEAIPID